MEDFDVQVAVEDFLKKEEIIHNQDDQLYYLYDESIGYYYQVNETWLKKFIFYYLDNSGEGWSLSKERMMLKALDTFVEYEELIPKKNIVVMENGTFKIDSKELVEHSKKFRAKTAIPITYDKKAKAPIFEKFISEISCGNTALSNTLIELLGYILADDMNANKAILLVGYGSNGKSTYLKLAKKLLGDDNCTNLSISDINGRAFNRHQLCDSKFNCIHELESDVTLESLFSDKVKSIITGDEITAEIKGGDLYSLKPKAKLVIASNHFPRINKMPDMAVLRRYLVLPFEASFGGNEVKLDMFEQLCEELSGIFNKAIEGYERLKANNFVFSYESKSQEIIREEIDKKFPVYGFCEKKIESCQGKFMSFAELRDSFTTYCKEKSIGNVTYSPEAFANQVKQMLSQNGISFKTTKSNGKRGLRDINIIG